MWFYFGIIDAFQMLWMQNLTLLFCIQLWQNLKHHQLIWIYRCLQTLAVLTVSWAHLQILMIIWTKMFKLVRTDFQSSSCVICHTSAFFPCFPSLKMAFGSHSSTEAMSDEALVNSRWISWGSRCMSFRIGVRYLLDFFFLCFFTFRYCSFALDSFKTCHLFVLHLSSFLKFF